MTETWDKIWTDVNIDSIGPGSNISNQWVKNILVRLKDEGDEIVEENRQLREAVEMSAEEIKERLYSAWYQAGVKQGGILYSLELDRKKLKKVEAWAVTPNADLEELEKILGVKK